MAALEKRLGAYEPPSPEVASRAAQGPRARPRAPSPHRLSAVGDYMAAKTRALPGQGGRAPAAGCRREGPVILTTEGQTSFIQRGKLAGANGCLIELFGSQRRTTYRAGQS
jgi:hypothetical protein